MLSKRFYDILFVVLIVLIILFQIFNQLYFSKNFDKLLDTSNATGANVNNFWKGIVIKYLVLWVILFIYWIFILILAIQLHSKNASSMVDTVVIAILIPFALIFYITNLRKKLKNYENGLNN